MYVIPQPQNQIFYKDEIIIEEEYCYCNYNDDYINVISYLDNFIKIWSEISRKNGGIKNEH